MKNALLEKLKRDEVALGVGLMYPSPSCIESMGKGWDWLWLDAQHGQLDYAAILHGVQVADLTGLSPVVRLPGHAPDVIGRILDTRARGLVVPLVNTADEARAIVQAAYFPPLGARSFGGRRVTDVGGREYYQTANEGLLLAVQIETLEAISRAEEMAAVEGVKALFFGPDDMKMRMGIPINTPIHESDKLAQAMDGMARITRDAGKFAGCVAAQADSLKMAVSLGYRLIVGGSDVVFLRTASAAKLEELHNALKEV